MGIFSLFVIYISSSMKSVHIPLIRLWFLFLLTQLIVLIKVLVFLFGSNFIVELQRFITNPGYMYFIHYDFSFSYFHACIHVCSVLWLYPPPLFSPNLLPLLLPLFFFLANLYTALMYFSFSFCLLSLLVLYWCLLEMVCAHVCKGRRQAFTALLSIIFSVSL